MVRGWFAPKIVLKRRSLPPFFVCNLTTCRFLPYGKELDLPI